MVITAFLEREKMMEKKNAGIKVKLNKHLKEGLARKEFKMKKVIKE